MGRTMLNICIVFALPEREPVGPFHYRLRGAA